MAMTAKEIEKKYGIGASRLDEIEEKAARGELPAEPVRRIYSRSPGLRLRRLGAGAKAPIPGLGRLPNKAKATLIGPLAKLALTQIYAPTHPSAWRAIRK